MIKIAHLTSAHPRHDPRIFLKMCSSLSKVYDIFLVVADGLGSEVKNNVNIVDVGVNTLGRLYRMTKTVRAVFLKAVELDADIYHLHDPELIPIGLLLTIKGKRVIFDMHENLSLQVMQKTWIPVIMRRFISVFVQVIERLSIPKFSALIVPQKIMKQMYFNLNKAVNVIANYPVINDVNFLTNRSPKESLIYSGAISVDRGLINMLEMMKHLPESYTLNLAGPIQPESIKLIEECEVASRVIYHGILSINELHDLYNKSGIGLIMFNNVGQYYMAYSLKLFEYMQSGLVVMMPNFGEWVDFNKRYSVGINVPVTNAAASAHSLLELCKDDKLQQGIKNQNTVRTEFNWNNEKEKLNLIYKKIGDGKC